MNTDNDRELLELAAKAVAHVNPETFKFHPATGRSMMRESLGQQWCEWNPLTADGDALRLAVKLGLCIHHDDHEPGVTVWHELDQEWVATPHGGDPYAATRRAIVRAAAEIGRSMK